MIKVLAVDDSAVVRQLIKHILESDPEIRVVGTASDGVEAVRLAGELEPDVITMDINMPHMNGLDATRTIMETGPVPIVIVTASYNRGDVEKSFLAMEAGAVAIVEKPMGAGHPGFELSSRELVQTVRLMSEVRVVRRWPKERFTRSEPRLEAAAPANGRGAAKNIRLVVIGASTGGPPVLQTILSGLKKGFGAPIVVVQHIAKGFLDGMVDWLGQMTELPVRIAKNGEYMMPGQVYFAPDDYHAGVAGNGRIEFSRSGPESSTRPSVSYLFRTALDAYGPDMAGVLLTGMGRDGAQELKDMKDRGAVTIIQDRESSVVYGMPGEALRLDAATFVMAPERISGKLESLVRRHPA